MGAVLAIDYGTKRLGLAVTDAGRAFVFPRDTRTRTAEADDFDFLRRLCDEDRIELIVVGLPLNVDGTEGGMAVAARAFGARVAKGAGRPVRFVDERYTTIEAEERLRERYPKDTRRRRSLRDRAAATIILRTFLDHGALP